MAGDDPLPLQFLRETQAKGAHDGKSEMGYTGVAVLGGSTAVAGGTLARTGPDVALWALVGVVLLIVGLILIRVGMLRRARSN